jgi:RNA-splicing ligase RtcB
VFNNEVLAFIAPVAMGGAMMIYAYVGMLSMRRRQARLRAEAAAAPAVSAAPTDAIFVADPGATPGSWSPKEMVVRIKLGAMTIENTPSNTNRVVSREAVDQLFDRR